MLDTIIIIMHARESADFEHGWEHYTGAKTTTDKKCCQASQTTLFCSYTIIIVYTVGPLNPYLTKVGQYKTA